MRALLLLLVAALPILATCAGKGTTELPPLVVAGVPWGPQEEARYRIVNRQGQEAGRATFTIQQREGPPGAPHEIADFVGTPPGPGGMGKNRGWLLRQRYQGPAATDELSIATGADLLPRRMERVVEDRQGKLRIEALYSYPTHPGPGPSPGEPTVAITWETGTDRRRRELPLPPQTYDNGVSLFLWRTIPFAPGYATTYYSLTAILRVERPRRVPVRLRVVGKETLAVPAGRWEAWRVQVQAPDRRHTAWYAVTGSHPLLQYNSGTLLFRLESLAPGP